MIERPHDLSAVQRLLRRYPIVCILGARQVGKTTLAHIIATTRARTTWFDMESPADNARLSDPILTLRELKGLVVIDEAQLRPDIFPVLRVLADRPRQPARFLLLGSASPALIRHSSQSLAGRIAYYELGSLSLRDVGAENHEQLWIKGGFPRAYLSRSATLADEWRRNFIATFLERDIPQLGITIAPTTLRRFWTMLAHYHGQVWNSSEFARSFGVADTTVRNYLDILTGALVIRQLQPWHENISRRQVKSPKVYVRDSGILHSLLGQVTKSDLQAHPKVGASWEGFAIEQLLNVMRPGANEAYFWATHSGAELDLLILRGRTRLGFEIKRTTAPTVTQSMRSALDALKLTRLDVIHAGDHTFSLAPKIRAVAISHLIRVAQESKQVP